MIEDFKRYLKINGVSKVTIKSYILKIKEYIQWYQESFGLEFSKLYRENVLDYLSYLQTVKKNNAKTINTKVSALIKFNEFLCECCIQEKMIINKNDRIRIQEQLVSPTKISKLLPSSTFEQISSNNF